MKLGVGAGKGVVGGHAMSASKGGLADLGTAATARWCIHAMVGLGAYGYSAY